MAVSHVKSNAVADWTGTVTVFNSQGVSATQDAAQIVGPAEWNSAHNLFYTLSGNTSNASTASGTNVVLSAGDHITFVGSTGTLGISSGEWASSYYYPKDGGQARIDWSQWGGQSTSGAVALNLPRYISASFMRLGVQHNIADQTASTQASTMNATATGGITYNAVFYSLGTGANSQSLQSVASCSVAHATRFSQSVATNGTQYTIGGSYTYGVEGNTTSSTMSYACSTSNYTWPASKVMSNLGTQDGRWVDVPFASSLSPGNYWCIFGISTTSSTQSARMSRCLAFFDPGLLLGNNQNVAANMNSVAPMGATNRTSGGHYGLGIFSTAGGGTTNSIPLSAISTNASQPLPLVQLLRSA